MPTKERTPPKKLLLVANVVKEHVLKFHVPTIKALKAQGWTVDVAASGEEMEKLIREVIDPLPGVIDCSCNIILSRIKDIKGLRL